MDFQILLSLVWIALQVLPILAQITPGEYELSNNIISESGSSVTGFCSSLEDSGRVCNAPNTSVLFDGIPTLTGLDGDMWARQLLTFDTSVSSASITFNFTSATDNRGIDDYTGVEIIEVVMFYCPTRVIGTDNIAVTADGGVIGNIEFNQNSASCEYLIRACDATLSTTSPNIALDFNKVYQSVYVAEITFYSDMYRKCSPGGPITTSVITTTTSVTTSDNKTNSESFSTAISSTTHSTTNELFEIITIVAVITVDVILTVLVIVIVIVLMCYNLRGRGLCRLKVLGVARQPHINALTVCKETGQLVNIKGTNVEHLELKESGHYNQEVFYSTIDESINVEGLKSVKINSDKNIEDKLMSQDMRCMTGVYASVNKSKKKKKVPDQPTEMYVTVNKKDKDIDIEKNTAKEQPNIQDLYSVVNKHMAPVIPMKSDDLLNDLDKEMN